MTRFDFELELTGLTPAPSQVWGAVRLVPLRRAEALVDLRVAPRAYPEPGPVDRDPREACLSYVPHGLVFEWDRRGEAVAPVETRLGGRDVARPDGPVLRLGRMARREGRNGLRLLPLHLTVQAHLALAFGGPQVAHRYWRDEAVGRRLVARWERSVRGHDLPDLTGALRVFEIQPRQCGVLIFLGDELASAFVVSHPDDYRALHDSLIADFYGELVSLLAPPDGAPVHELRVALNGGAVNDLDDLAAALDSARREWAQLEVTRAGGLFGRVVSAERVREAGRYRLLRFHTGFDVERAIRGGGEHLGEALRREDGQLGYLRTYRLDRGQIRRGRMLSTLAAFDWDLEAVAEAEGHGRVRRVLADIERAGLGWLIAPE